ncbi:hypothetical protein, partial [Megamonas funiformis]|uniref:hypothetical protein n=1 Tax=Megamonas funiformis TaxID=437897 RepID=UPI00241F4E6F
DVRDIDGNELFSMDTSGPVQDLKLVGNYLYVAEGNYGIEVYSQAKQIPSLSVLHQFPKEVLA